MMEETVAGGLAFGIRIGTDAVERALEYLDSARPDIKASMQLDVEAARPSELDALIGVIMRTGRVLGITKPIASSIYSLLLPLELRAQ